MPAVQAAAQETTSASEAYLAQAAPEALSSDLERQDHGKRRVVLTPVACRAE